MRSIGHRLNLSVANSQCEGFIPSGSVLRARSAMNTVRHMHDLLVLGIHPLVTFAKLLHPGGVLATVAESRAPKHQLPISNRSRHRAAKLTPAIA
jgi:hypothetical protein